jgi:hypothetical protein
MSYHLGRYFTVGCPLRGGRGEKTLKDFSSTRNIYYKKNNVVTQYIVESVVHVIHAFQNSVPLRKAAAMQSSKYE